MLRIARRQRDLMTQIKEHPFVRVCRENNMTYRQFAEAVQKTTGRVRPAPEYISQIARGHRYPSRKLLGEIRLAFPEISFEEVMGFLPWKRDGTAG